MILDDVILPRTRRVARLLVTGALAVVMAACAPSRLPYVAPVDPLPGLPPLLTWMGEFTRPAAAPYPMLADSGRFGSLSGLVRDAASGQWVAVIDDREGTRVAWLTIDFAAGGLTVSPSRMMPLRAGPGVGYRVAGESDLEAITALPDGTFLMAEEGHLRDGEVWQPAILHVTRDGVVTSVTPFPEAFSISEDPARGLRDNQGIESLTRTPGGRVIAGLEQPLKDDGDATSFERPGTGRLIEFEPAGRRWQPGRQWRYMISPTPRVEGYPQVCSDGENGLVDLLALTDTRLIAMERACLLDQEGERTANAVQLFIVDLVAGDARKTLMLNLSTLTAKLSPALSRLDNFEALSFGPPMANGRRTLLVVSDDNFRATQKTSFLLFGLR